MTLLETISGPRDLDALSPEQLEQLGDRDPRVPRGIRVEDRAVTWGRTSASWR
jgi:hypothetical protein